MTKSLEKQLIDKHDLAGKTFSKWTVLEYVGRGRYKARCVCGFEAIRQGAELMNMRSEQCFRCYAKQKRARAQFRNQYEFGSK